MLKWIADRLEGLVGARETAIGRVPKGDDLDLEGLDITNDQLALLLGVDPEVWSEEADLIPEAYSRFGERLPDELWTEYDALRGRLGAKHARAPEPVA